MSVTLHVTVDGVGPRGCVDASGGMKVEELKAAVGGVLGLDAGTFEMVYAGIRVGAGKVSDQAFEDNGEIMVTLSEVGKAVMELSELGYQHKTVSDVTSELKKQIFNPDAPTLDPLYATIITHMRTASLCMNPAKMHDLAVLTALLGLENTLKTILEDHYEGLLGDALLVACREGRLGCVEAVLSHPAISAKYVNQDVYQGWYTPLSSAARYGHADCVKALLESEFIDVNAGYPLTRAAAEGHVAIVKLLLAHPSTNVNQMPPDLSPPLATAVSAGYTECAQEILKHPNVDVNKCNPLAIATQKGDVVMQNLLKAHPGQKQIHGVKPKW
eukprot:TRINITY_DN44500_c0_g1_i1.p1 TRINITY_DN44500_c0_g1~~TRINITY_DN44500_c0_g1_i1.p1  ORF type:complete len:347 (+),score=55.73 TRINITY_DN44500_c0_g1_i1:57-1043(+)